VRPAGYRRRGAPWSREGTTPPELLGIDDDWPAGLTDRLDRELGMTLPPAPRTPEPVVVRPASPRAKEADDVPA
jgi:hypothetical protein